MVNAALAAAAGSGVMTEHTPGPWEAGEFADRTGDWLVSAKRQRYFVADVYTEADARLIAAAPDMLAALKQIHHYETIRDPNRGELFLGALHAVEAAIAKVEGKP
jgi:hypothetical protein